MIRCAARTIIPCGEDGRPEQGRRIDIGDRCVLGPLRGGLRTVSYPVAKGVRSAYVSSTEGFAAVYCQRDYGHVPYPAPGYEAATVKSGGCGPTAAAMVVETLRPDERCDPVLAASYARLGGARVSGGTDMGLLGRLTGQRFGLSVTATSALAELRAHLKKGGVAIANVAGRGMFSTGGHYLVVLAEEDGLLTIADPGYYGGKYGVRYPRRRAAVRVAGPDHLLRCAPSVLDADCVGRSPRYYLFR